MLPSAHAFLAHLLDYAGMFPPAALPLPTALKHYLDYRRASPHAGMLGRFVCPASRLHEIERADLTPENAALLHITALGQQAGSEDEIYQVLETDLRAIQKFRDAWGSAAVVDTLEMPFPKDVPVSELGDRADGVWLRLEEMELCGFVELPRQCSWRWGIAELSADLGAKAAGILGLKLRCGGITADAFPSDEDVAHFIRCCSTTQTPWKATAGLHHPHRFWDESLQLWQHGFLNVFGAGVLAASQPLSEADIAAILADREGRHLRFNSASISWKDWDCPLAKIMEARSKVVCSFGSCSFEEPLGDLIALGFVGDSFSVRSAPSER